MGVGGRAEQGAAPSFTQPHSYGNEFLHSGSAHGRGETARPQNKAAAAGSTVKTVDFDPRWAQLCPQPSCGTLGFPFSELQLPQTQCLPPLTESNTQLLHGLASSLLGTYPEGWTTGQREADRKLYPDVHSGSVQSPTSWTRPNGLSAWRRMDKEMRSTRTTEQHSATHRNEALTLQHKPTANALR